MTENKKKINIMELISYMTDYSTEAAAVADAINAVYENKQVNKKNSISGDYSSDNASYPTVKAVKAEFGHKVTSFSNPTSDDNYPSEKLVKSALDDKVNVSDVKDNLTSTDTDKPLSAKQGKELKYLIDNIDTSDKTVSITKQATAETGYAHTYVISQGGVALSPKINIPKDYLVKEASLKTVGSTPTQAEIDAGLTTGDKYISLIVYTYEESTAPSGATELIIPVNDLVDEYTADNVTLQMSNNQFSIKTSGVDTTQIKDSAVTADKIASAVKSSWLTSSDVAGEIGSFASALADAINPSSP